MNSSPSSSSNSASLTTTTTTNDPMQSWWESISKARSRIHSLAAILPSSSSSLLPLADSDRPALSLLSSAAAYSAVSLSLSSPLSGSGSDPLCHWLYDTFLSSDDPHLRLVVLSFLPLLSATYLSRLHHSPSSLSGFEAVLLGLYSSEVKSRAGKPLLVSIPDLSHPSIYHTPLRRNDPPPSPSSSVNVGVMCPPLEPMPAVKSTKRASIVGVALDCYFRQISHMPHWSKLEFCRFASAWAGQCCPCERDFDFDVGVGVNHNHDHANGDGEIEVEVEVEEEEGVVKGMGELAIQRYGGDGECSIKGERIPLPWEILQPVLRILGHCLLAPLNSQEVKDCASVAARRLYARVSHDLVPQAILATRSLVQLDKRARESAKVVAAASTASASSNANTPTKAKKPEILLVSK